jgi:TolA-binding protein
MMKQLMVLTLSFLLVAGALAAPTPQDTAPAGSTGTAIHKKKRAPVVNPVTKRLDEMQQAIGAQQQQIQQLMQELQSRDAAIQQLQQQNTQAQSAATQAQQKADAAAAQASQQQLDVAAVKSDVTDLKSNVTNTALTLQETQKNIHEMESPLAVHYKGIAITPGGFLAAESVWRQHALGSDINTPFNSIPMPGSSLNQLS